MEVIQVLLEVIKYTVPALVVYFLMRQLLKGQIITEQLRIQRGVTKETLALRLQAYERLILFCERINLVSLMMRLNSAEISSEHLKNAMLVSIQKEFEHNLAQQVYVSGQLWEMIQLLKEKSISITTQSFIKNKDRSKKQFEEELVELGQSLNQKMTSKVKEAIRKEVAIYFQ